MGDIIRYMNYNTYEAELRQELQKQADSFVRTGYLLRLGMDTDVLKESGYYNVNEFAKAVFNIDASTVSRYININMRFSEGGYSEKIAEQYSGLGYAKLSLMLLLPDEINEELTAAFSKTEVQAIKEEYDEEKQISDLEVLLEGEDVRQVELESMLAKALHQLGMDEPELFLKLFEAYKTRNENVLVEGFRDVLIPQGENIYSVRPKGIGRLMISVKESSEEVVIINVRSGEKENYDWGEATKILVYFMYGMGEDGKTVWQNLYGQPFPEKEEIAPVQPIEKENKKSEPRKQSKVIKAKKETPTPSMPEPVAETEEQLPGQDSILNHPEYLPEEMKMEQENAAEGFDNQETHYVGGDDTEAENTETYPHEESNVAAGDGADATEETVQNVGENTEDIWNRAEAAQMRLTFFFDEYDVEEQRRSESFHKELGKAYLDALSLAADLERMLNHG